MIHWMITLGILFLGGHIEAADPIEKSLPHYIALQEALAADNLDAALKTGQLKAKTLSEARKEFKKMTPPIEAWVSKHPGSGYIIVYCPMAGAKWVQREGKISNPYLGKEMLNCGEQIK